MDSPITILIDDESIKFTPEGKVAVLDAITSLSGIENEHMVWERLLSRWPELEGVCEPYKFSRDENMLVTDVGGWEMIQSALFDYLIEINE
jgi:hypothetical protein